MHRGTQTIMSERKKNEKREKEKRKCLPQQQAREKLGKEDWWKETHTHIIYAYAYIANIKFMYFIYQYSQILMSVNNRENFKNTL